MVRGALLLVLHAHLPYVRHPEDEDHLEEGWLTEAVLECYLPLLEMLERLADERVPLRLTLSLTAPLVTMLEDPLLQRRIGERLAALQALADREVRRTAKDAAFGPAAAFHRDRLQWLEGLWSGRYRRRLVPALTRLRDAGLVELIASGATHGFLPLLRPSPEAVHAQVAVGVAEHTRALGAPPSGFWLPECGYFPGVERVLASEQLRFTFLDAHGLADAAPRPLRSVHAPAFTASGVAVYARDPEASEQVWSAEAGYPADPLYRDFYRDVGWDLPLPALVPVVQEGRPRRTTGLKYHRITGRTDHKAPWAPEPAFARAREHARDFVQRTAHRTAALAEGMDRDPLVVAPYDAELFGHWWFEGPAFLEELFREAARAQLPLVTPADDLQAWPEAQVVSPVESSWGERGHAATWLDPSNDWIPAALFGCAEMLAPFARAARSVSPLEDRALRQAFRELLLAQSSDFAFILKSGTVAGYARSRVESHLTAFADLVGGVRSGAIDAQRLAALESAHPIFPDLKLATFRTGGGD
jgi:1,4-alpha-glucan branching enzyme